ncbi:MAG: ThiF family adenylyltransferase [Bacteroidales bacterium]|nr:ThiF family adenylyltransferase [Bacteroidales bacterium]
MTPKPVFYIDGEELKRFATNPRVQTTEGIGYEWEGEGVWHLHFHPLTHSFGHQQTVTFTKEQLDEPYDPSRILVKVNAEGEAQVWHPQSQAWLAPEIIPAKEDLYSRNKGLLELNILEGKRVMIVGLGSFGSQIAIELAKAGVGHFAIMDFDRVELHNLARHTSTTRDLGRLKTDVIEEAILGKNPYAKVEKFPININDDPQLLLQETAKADLVICATDNNRSRFNINSAAVATATPAIYGRAITRAEGGDVFHYRPGGPCYCCLLGNGWYDATMEEITDEASARANGQIAAYTSAEDADAMVQVGLSADIEPMTNMMVKLALVELSRGAASGIQSLEEELIYPYYMWANRRERNYTNWASFANPGHMPTIMRWYGVEMERDGGCAQCGNATSLDLGQDFAKEFGPEASSIKIDTSIDLDKL